MLILFVVAASLFVSPTFAQEAETNARWQVDYSGAKCRLIRHFGPVDKGNRLEFDKNWSLGGYDLRLYGKDVPAFSAPTTITLAFGSPLTSHRFKTNPYMFESDNERAIGWSDPDNIFMSALSQARHVNITGAKKLILALELPNAPSAIKALEKCEDELVTGWGFDASHQRSLTAHVKPSNHPGRWATTLDYPRVDFVSKNEGVTTFLLNVGADGSITDCRIAGTSGFPSLDEQTCALLRSRAAFHPATDKAGKPVPSFYINRILWQVPR